MAVIQRPAKEGNATTYQGKVAAGYTKILAAEVDADIDTIYAAWNAGVDASNIKPGVITGAMLAPGVIGSRELTDGGIQTVDIGAQQVTLAKLGPDVTTAGGDLAGSYPNPSLGTVQAGRISINPRVQLYASGTTLDVFANAQGTPSYDSTKPSHMLRLDYTGDRADFWRAPVGSPTAWVNPFHVSGSDGKTYCTLGDQTVSLAMLGVASTVQYLGSVGISITALSNAEVLLAQLVWTSRGGPWFALAATQGHFGAPTSGAGVTANLRLDGTAGVPTDGTVVGSAGLTQVAPVSGIVMMPFGLNCAATGSGLSAGSHRLKLTGYVTGSLTGAPQAETGYILIGELA